MYVSRLMSEAEWIRKSKNMSQDDGSYRLSHGWDRLMTDVSPDEDFRSEVEMSINKCAFSL